MMSFVSGQGPHLSIIDTPKQTATCIFCGFSGTDLEYHLYTKHLDGLMKLYLRKDIHRVKWAIEEGKKFSSGLRPGWMFAEVVA